MKSFRYLINTLLLVLLCSQIALANIEALQFDKPTQQQRYQNLIKELRCLVCQNQNLADSNAELAKDLRRKTYEMVKQGQSDKEILGYMQQRYGDFVLYRPPFNMGNALLWIGPFALFFIILLLLFSHIKQRAKQTVPSNDEEHKQVRQLLDDIEN